MSRLADFRKIVQHGDIPVIDNVTRSDLLAALGLVIECEECGGLGWLSTEPQGLEPLECPSCFDGYRVAPELVELVYQSHPAAGRENAEQLLRQVFEGGEK